MPPHDNDPATQFVTACVKNFSAWEVFRPRAFEAYFRFGMISPAKVGSWSSFCRTLSRKCAAQQRWRSPPSSALNYQTSETSDQGGPIFPQRQREHSK
jgi:hypothetical protein